MLGELEWYSKDWTRQYGAMLGPMWSERHYVGQVCWFATLLPSQVHKFSPSPKTTIRFDLPHPLFSRQCEGNLSLRNH